MKNGYTQTFFILELCNDKKQPMGLFMAKRPDGKIIFTENLKSVVLHSQYNQAVTKRNNQRKFPTTAATFGGVIVPPDKIAIKKVEIKVE